MLAPLGVVSSEDVIIDGVITSKDEARILVGINGAENNAIVFRIAARQRDVSTPTFGSLFQRTTRPRARATFHVPPFVRHLEGLDIVRGRPA